VSAEDREVDLVYYHEKCVDEVAHILEARRAVKTRMFYARKKKLAPLGHWG
jgi:RNA polymerase sigma-70 factor, ECF subfamily